MAFVNARSRRIDRINELQRAESGGGGLPDPGEIPSELELRSAFGNMM